MISNKGIQHSVSDSLEKDLLLRSGLLIMNLNHMHISFSITQSITEEAGDQRGSQPSVSVSL